MGLLDRAKAGLSNAGNYTAQKNEELSYNSKISDQKAAKKKNIEQAGNIMFEAYVNGSVQVTDEVKELFEKAIECDREVERLEAEKAEMIAKAESERQDRRDAVKAQEEKEKAEKEAAKNQ